MYQNPFIPNKAELGNFCFVHFLEELKAKKKVFEIF